MPVPFSLALHGGAGTIAAGSADDEAPYHAGLRAALAAGQAVLEAGGSALDAVVAAVVSLEDCPLFNAGVGATFTSAETHELDAGVMDGATLGVGAVTGLRTVRNPVLGALEILRDGRCVLMAGEGAERFVLARGLAQVPPEHFSTAHRRAQLHALRAQGREDTRLDHDAGRVAGQGTGGAGGLGARSADGHFGTVGAVARDRQGHLAAAGSTGGMTNKRPGRVGDTPIVGAGLYANDASCAVAATGTGEHFLRACVAHELHARLRHGGQALAGAARAVIDESLTPLGGQGGFVSIDRHGEIAMPFNSSGMYRAWVREGGEPSSAVFGVR